MDGGGDGDGDGPIEDCLYINRSIRQCERNVREKQESHHALPTHYLSTYPTPPTSP